MGGASCHRRCRGRRLRLLARAIRPRALHLQPRQLPEGPQAVPGSFRRTEANRPRRVYQEIRPLLGFSSERETAPASDRTADAVDTEFKNECQSDFVRYRRIRHKAAKTKEELIMSDLSPAPDYVLSLDAFVRSIGIKKHTPHAMFLGAGASITSKIPSAGLCIWEWKRDIFLTNNPGLEDQFTELSLPSVKRRIQNWLDGKGGHPPAGADEEYSHYIEKCYPSAENRRAYFQSKVQAAKPHIGYQLLCAMAEAEIIR